MARGVSFKSGSCTGMGLWERKSSSFTQGVNGITGLRFLPLHLERTGPCTLLHRVCFPAAFSGLPASSPAFPGKAASCLLRLPVRAWTRFRPFRLPQTLQAPLKTPSSNWNKPLRKPPSRDGSQSRNGGKKPMNNSMKHEDLTILFVLSMTNSKKRPGGILFAVAVSYAGSAGTP